MYRTVIVEDDPVITLLNRRYIEKDERFCVVQTFSAAHPALFWLRSNPVDLIILDVYMPQMNGLELLRMLRAEGVDSDVIMVTSANDAETIEALMRLGVTDYLIKPFGLERFQLALDTFCNRKMRFMTAHRAPSRRISWIVRCCTFRHRCRRPRARRPKDCRQKRWSASSCICSKIPAGTPAMTLQDMWTCRLSRCGAM